MNNLCPICNEEARLFVTEGRDFFVHDGKSEPFDVYFCENCKIGYSTPFLTDPELSQYYPDDYEAYEPKKGLMAYLQTLKYQSDLKIVKRWFSGKGNTMFEVGSGRGEFLAEAKKNGFSVEGVEPGDAGRQYAKKQFGIDLINEWASDIVYEKKYDVVVLRHVIEHLNHPLPVIENIFKNGLNPGGLLFLKFPRLDSWETRLFGRYCDCFDFPRHRIHFTKEGIEKILGEIGFSDIRIRSEVVPTSIIRGVQYYAAHGNSGVLNFLAKGWTSLPYFIKFTLAQLLGLLMLPLGTGRVIVSARKGIS